MEDHTVLFYTEHALKLNRTEILSYFISSVCIEKYMLTFRVISSLSSVIFQTFLPFFHTVVSASQQVALKLFSTCSRFEC
jgi:hypothetical protein